MPLTDIQTRILETIAGHRDPENYVAGGTVLNTCGRRLSEDIDLFSDRRQELDRVIEMDRAALVRAGFTIDWKRRGETFRSAMVGLNDRQTRLDWSVDSDYRFFPTERDDLFGYRLHPVDQAANKIAAAVDRHETRDLLDLNTVAIRILPLGAVAWAAAEKSPGLSPDMIIHTLRRRAVLRQEAIDRETLMEPIDAGRFNTWLRTSCDHAQAWIDAVPSRFGFGVVINREGCPCAPDFSQVSPDGFSIHVGAQKGAWPTSPQISSAMLDRPASEGDGEGGSETG